MQAHSPHAGHFHTRHPGMPGSGLYAITGGTHVDLVAAARAALQGGAAILQYRDKARDADRRLREARALSELCREFAVPLIINDDVELASRCTAAGVHLGEDDPAIGEARALLGPQAIIGASCYDSLQRARDAAAAGADYLAFGAFFPTSTKAVTRRATPALLGDARELGLPLVAIGGITPDNGGSLVAAGADFLAVVSALFGARDVRAMAGRFTALFEPRDTP
jgi:thiamine-phosphate pyrophosphorylase